MHLSERAEALWEQIQRQYIAAGFPPQKAWFVALAGDNAEVRELEAARYVEARSVGRAHFGLADPGLHELLNRNHISEAATELRKTVAHQYEAEGFPPYQSWILQPGTGEAAAVNELVARGFFEHFAVGGQVRLTSYGQRWIMTHRIA